MTTSQAIPTNLWRLRAFWFETIFTPTYIGHLEIVDKKRVSLEIEHYTGPISGKPYGTYHAQYFIYLNTTLGHLAIKVSRYLFDFLEQGDHVVVRYRRGRLTGCLRGEIAR